MASHPPEPFLLHRLPPAPHFVGRQAELEELRRLWQEGFSGVVALVGLGGAGKTAVAARFLDEILQTGAQPRPEGLFVWSFYVQPDAGQFLEAASQYFGREDASAGIRGAALLQLLKENLAGGGRYLLVLDGLEKVQRQEGASGVFGQIEDPLLKGLLIRVAEGAGKTLVLITSRFPLTDLHTLRDRGYRSIEVHGLEPGASVELLRHHGVQGDDAALEALVHRYGAHALTLDHLGGLVGKFLGGDPERAPELPALASAGSDRQALRLARLLQAYEEHLPAAEMGLLCRLCLPRRSMSLEQIVRLFLVSPPVRERTIRELHDQIPRLPTGRTCSDRDTAELADAIKEVLEEALCAAPIAGPEDIFSAEVLDLADTLYRFRDAPVACEFAELVHLYAESELEPPSDLLPLPAQDRQHLRFWYDRYTELRPLFVKQTSEEAPKWLKGLTPKSKTSRRPAEDISPGELVLAFIQVERQLHFVTAKHFTLRRLRQLCRLYQRKWVLAGPLAALDAAAVKELLDSLVARHLALREGEEHYSVHPAVRDHFARLAPAGEQETWHDLLREHLLSLMHRPGMRRPETPEALDLAEDALHHALEGGRTGEALDIYEQVLGGLRHLGWKLGEMNRGLRILRRFEPCPDRWAQAWFLRALGELDAAYEQNGLAPFRADIRLLQGRLPEVAAEQDDGRTAVARFLMGESRNLPPDPLGCVIPRDQILLYLGRLTHVQRTTLHESFYRDIGWEGDRARCLLFLAETARRQAGDLALCQEYLNAASPWILHSGSVEHLALLQLLRARLARARGDQAAAQRALSEGLHLARRAGLGLYHIELLCEQAELQRLQRDPAAPETARRARALALADECRFLWGAAEAGQLLGQVLVDLQQVDEARAVLQQTLELRQRLGDPHAWQTEELLRRARSN